MSQRRPSTARAIQLALILGAAVLLTLYVRDLASRPEPEAPPAAPLPRGAGARIVRIEHLALEPSAGDAGAPGPRLHLLVERAPEGESWRLREPIDDLASTRTVRELVRAVEELRVERLLASGDLADFGLQPPRHRLLLYARGSPPLTIDVGDYTPSGLEVYARWDALEGIAIIPRYLAGRFLETDLMTWRESEMLPPRPAAIDSATVLIPGEPPMRLERRDYKEWRFVAPEDREADGELCERATAAFWRFSYSLFVDDPLQWPLLGLQPPQATWIVYRGDHVDTLLIGDRVAEGQMAVRLRGRSPGLVRDDLHAMLTGGPEALEMRRLVRGEPRDQRLIVLVTPEQARAYARGPAGWRTRELTGEEASAAAAGRPPGASPERDRPAEDPSLGGDLINLFNLRAAAWLDPLPEPADPARNEAPLHIHFWDGAGTHQWILLYPDDPEALTRFLSPPAGQSPALAAPPELDARAVGSAHPGRPMRIESSAAFNWLLRAARP